MGKKKIKVQVMLVIICLCLVIGMWLLHGFIQQKSQQQVIETLRQLDIATISQITLTAGPNEIVITDNNKMAYLINAIQHLELVSKVPLHKLAPGATAYGCGFKLFNDDLIVVTLPCLTLSVNGRSISGYYQISNDSAIISSIQSLISEKRN